MVLTTLAQPKIWNNVYFNIKKERARNIYCERPQIALFVTVCSSVSGGINPCLSLCKSAKSRLIRQPEGLPCTEQVALAPANHAKKPQFMTVPSIYFF
jgi:hypothetical protein